MTTDIDMPCSPGAKMLMDRMATNPEEFVNASKFHGLWRAINEQGDTALGKRWRAAQPANYARVLDRWDSLVFSPNDIAALLKAYEAVWEYALTVEATKAIFQEEKKEISVTINQPFGSAVAKKEGAKLSFNAGKRAMTITADKAISPGDSITITSEMFEDYL